MTIIAQISSSVVHDYNWLKATVADWMHRTNLTGQIPDCIAFTESRTTRLLNARMQELQAPLATVAGQQYASLPSDLLRVMSVSIPQSSPSLNYVTMDQLNMEYDPSYSGVPLIYTTLGDLIYFGPTPDAIYNCSLTYKYQVPQLSDAAPENSLLTKWPDVYLWGALYHAAKYSENLPKAQQYESDYLRAVDEINVIDWHAGGPMRMRSDVRSV